MLFIIPNHSLCCSAPLLGVAYIATVLENNGEKVKVIDCQINKRYKKEIAGQLKEHAQVAISSNIATISNALEIARFIRKISPKTRIIMGGPQPTAIYNNLIPYYADIVVMGEGEDTVLELVHTNDLSLVKGIAYWDNGIKVNAHRELIDNLDKIDFPEWQIYDLRRYRFGNVLNPFVFMLTSRGCPFDCIYCTKFIHGYKIRFRSLDNVINEINYLVERFRVKEILIMDDNFTFDIQRVKEFCERVISKQYGNLRFSLPGGIRADINDDSVFNLMAKAGFYWVGIGGSSASQEIENKLERQIDLKMTRSTIEKIRKVGIKVHLNFMLGLPFDNLSSMRQTIEFAKSLPVETVYFYAALPFPGTKFYKMVEERGRFMQDLTMHSAHYFGKPVYEIGNLTINDVKRMLRFAYYGFYLRPKQFLWVLAKIAKFPLNNFLSLMNEKSWLFRP